jgi:hypothetical protein
LQSKFPCFLDRIANKKEYLSVAASKNSFPVRKTLTFRSEEDLFLQVSGSSPEYPEKITEGARKPAGSGFCLNVINL